MEGVYHSGELDIQEKVGEQLQANSNGKVITNKIIKGAVNFLEKQPMAIVSTVDNQKRVWTSLLVGDYGFISVNTESSLSFKKNMIYSNTEDIFFKNCVENSFIGCLFIELETRRRFRINGLVKTTNNTIDIDVLEAYPNCPKYIQQRVISSPEGFFKVSSNTTTGAAFTPNIHKWITSSDTLFVGSQSTNQRMDASHRGGNPGFIEILNETTLKIPDYAGNSMYNTFGNITQNPNTGLLFIDFKTKSTLQLTGKAWLLFNQNSKIDFEKTGGTGRYWIFQTEEWKITSNHHNVDWEFLSYSPFNPTA